MVDPTNNVPVVRRVTLLPSPEDAKRIITLEQFLRGASDADGDPLTVTNVRASSGVITDNGNDTWTYVPKPDSDTNDIIRYTVSDGKSESEYTTLRFDFIPVNDAPEARDVFLGNTFQETFSISDLDGSNGFVLKGLEENDNIGSIVSSAGDINGDGFDDIMISDPGFSWPVEDTSGETFVIFGAKDGFDAEIPLNRIGGSNGFVFEGRNIGDKSGYWISAAGDVNGDGLDDILISAAHATEGGLNRGVTYVVYGTTDGFPARLGPDDIDGTNGFVINGGPRVGGRNVASAGDFNGDGLDDILIGMPGARGERLNSGKVFVIYGDEDRPGRNLNLSDLNGDNGFAINGTSVGDGIGDALSTAGDINGDGFDDILIGAPSANGKYRDTGKTYVVFGSDSGFDEKFSLNELDGTNGFRRFGNWMYEYTGRSVASAGDINGDGFDDIIIGGDVRSSPVFPNTSETYVIFGKNGGFETSSDFSDLDGTNGFIIRGKDGDSPITREVSSAGDVNGDGYSDILVSAEVGASGRFGSRNSLGESYLIYGTSDGFEANYLLSELDGRKGVRIVSSNEGDELGQAASSLGDVNGDGYDDFILGAPGVDIYDPRIGTLRNTGESYVIFGGPTGFPADRVSTIDTKSLLANDSDIDGDDLTVIALSATSTNGAKLMLNGDGTISYDPTPVVELRALAEGETLADSFAYTISDGNGGTATAMATLDVLGVNDDPRAMSLRLASGEEDAPRVITAAELLEGATDIDGDTLSIDSLVLQSGDGNLSDNGNGTWTYLPAANAHGTVALRYAVSDGKGGTASGTAKLSIISVNDAPVINNQRSDLEAISTKGAAFEGTIVASDVDGDALTYAILRSGAPQNGTVSVDNNGGYSFTPDAGFTGADSFVVQVTDPSGASDQVEVSVTINADLQQIAGLEEGTGSGGRAGETIGWFAFDSDRSGTASAFEFTTDTNLLPPDTDVDFAQVDWPAGADTTVARALDALTRLQDDLIDETGLPEGAAKMIDLIEDTGLPFA